VPTALLTGAPTHAAAATALLERGGFSVLDGSPPPAPPVDCYLQLPAAGGAGRDLAARLDALVAVAARLDRRASVLLAVDDGDAGRAVSDELLVALAQVVLEDYGRPEARVTAVAVAELYTPAAALSAAVRPSASQAAST